MKERIKELGYWLEDKLKELCGEITTDKRLTVIIIMLLLFTILNLYFTFTSIKTWGMEEERREQLKIEHMKGLELEKSKPKKMEFDFDFLDSELDIAMPDSIIVCAPLNSPS
ncbi:TraL conjugative transposon family protein [Dysgonomonas termitidis]|uniref:TraL conjugative transposon family protein n=1 Tax=Dysgonomonas termitidis TaxID=1516126 RepID=A0ABV9L0R4_9BACT